MNWIWKCPINHGEWWKSIAAEIQQVIKSLKDWSFSRENIDTKNKIHSYALFAVKIEEFYEKHKWTLQKRFSWIFEENDTREEYLAKIRNHLWVIITHWEFLIDLDPIWIHINNGIWTMILVLMGLFEKIPNISQEDCKKICREWMRELDIKDFPVSRKQSTIKNYKNLIRTIIEQGTSKHYEWKLYCPAIYTKWWNDLVNVIVDAVFDKFPN